MTRALWRINFVLLLCVMPLLASCQPIQAPELPNASTADVLRAPYTWQEQVAAAPGVSAELYGWEKVAAAEHAAKLAQSVAPEVSDELYGWEKVAAAEHAAKLAQSIAPEVSDELYGWEKVAAAEYAAKLAHSVVPEVGAELYGWEKVAAAEYAARLAQNAADASVELAGYANPQALATTAWLAAHLDDPTVRVLDVRRPTGAANFAVAHIPNAQHVDLMVDLMDRDPNRVALDLIGPERFAVLMGRLGIANDATVVVYDAEGGTAAATLWWALRYYGHADVRILNGGLVKWLIEGRETTHTVAHFAPTEYTIRVQPQLLATAADVELAMHDPAVFVVDARDPEYYTGARCLSAAPRAGHIPGALMMPARWQVAPDTKTLLPAERLAMSLQWMNIAPAQHGITYCGNGHLAAFDAFLLYAMGFEDVAVYDSAWLEWGVLPDMPVETGCPDCEAM